MCSNLAYRLQRFESGWRCPAAPERRQRSAVTLALVGQIELSDIEHNRPTDCHDRLHSLIPTTWHSYLDSPEARAGGPPCADELPPTFDGSLHRGLARVTGHVRAVALRRRPGRMSGPVVPVVGHHTQLPSAS
jgi:hypothetical protein